MALTLALFSFVNAAHNDVTDDVDALLGATAPKKEVAAVKKGSVGADEIASAGEKVLHLKETVSASSREINAKRKQALKEAFACMGSACKNVSGAVWDYTTSGTLVSDLKDAHDWVLSEENLKKANDYKDRAYGLCHNVGVTVPTWALAAAAAIFADSVSTEFVCASEIYALALGGTLCYVASRFNPFSSKRQACDPRVEHCKKHLMALKALRASIESPSHTGYVREEVNTSLVKDETSSSDDEEDTAVNGHDQRSATREKESDASVVDDLLKEKEDASPVVEAEKKHEAPKHESSHHSDGENDDDSALSLRSKQTAVPSK